ncbi:MAG: hypothetical protein AABX04_06730 [Nanoarchaeota archaeon]
MKLEELLLKKEELPILGEASRFVVPIHPALLQVKLDPDLCHRVFPQVAQEWYIELSAYAETVEDPEIKKWYREYFLAQEPIIEMRTGRQTIKHLWWQDLHQIRENGFAEGLGITRDQGMLLLNEEPQYVPRGLVNFVPDKFAAYTTEKMQRVQGMRAFIYERQNITTYPAALFMRNWAMMYLNEVMKSVESQIVTWPEVK